ncbi:MAG: hypothetical protein V7633_925 [Pseudonocardia sp.]
MYRLLRTSEFFDPDYGCHYGERRPPGLWVAYRFTLLLAPFCCIIIVIVDIPNVLAQRERDSSEGHSEVTLFFINYRTGDEDGTAALLDRELSRLVGSDAIFRAGKSIPPWCALGRGTPQCGAPE